MQAVIIADRSGQELAPLCDKSPMALLPVINRPLLQFTLEDLAENGITEVLLVLSSRAERVELEFARGEYLGLSIRYLLSRGEESADDLLKRFSSLLKPPFMVARGDVLRGPCMGEFLARAEDIEGSQVNARIGWRSGAMSLVREWPASVAHLNWPLDDAAGRELPSVDMPTGLMARLDSLADYHLSCLGLLGGKVEHIQLPGHEQMPGLRLEHHSMADHRSLQAGQALIGAKTSVHASARIAGPCIIGHDCYLDRGVQIRNSLVLPGTYVGENLQVENAILAGDQMIRVDKGVSMAIPDPMLLSDMESEVSGMVEQWPESILATMLLILSLPLWPLALLLSLLSSPKRPLRSVPAVSNRFEHTPEGRQRVITQTTQFATRIPIMRHLPMLWPVIRGDLRLFGSALLSPQRLHGSAALWDPRREMPMSGLLGPAQLLLPPDAPEEEVRLTEVDFVSQTCVSSLLCRLSRSTRLLFSRRAWMSVSSAG